ncbi:MAG TPA: hypothetical protein VEY88_26490 [Archangium sp.]|nr:hypothetical protein [Archangium sp.]
MNARLLAAFLCLTTLGTGCIIVDGDGGGDTGTLSDVTFLWTFGADGRCVDVPNVKSIRLTIPGETLDSNGNYACNTAGVDGITLRRFRNGTYNYTLNAIDAYNQVVYTTSGSFTVNGTSRQVRVDLTPDGKTYAYVSWYFPAKGSFSRPTCAQANVTSMKASIDNGEWVTVDCTQGQTGMGIATPYLNPGQHSLQLIAYGYDSLGRNNMPLYNLYGTFTTQRGEPVSAQFGFFAVGGISVRWDFWDGSNYRDCAQTGVTQVVWNLLDVATNTLVFGDAGESHACGAAPVVNQFLKPGDYKVFIRGYVGSTKSYTNEASPTVYTVKAFEQKTRNDASTTVVMSKL